MFMVTDTFSTVPRMFDLVRSIVDGYGLPVPLSGMVMAVDWVATYWPKADTHINRDATPPRTHAPGPRVFLVCFFIIIDLILGSGWTP